MSFDLLRILTVWNDNLVFGFFFTIQLLILTRFVYFPVMIIKQWKKVKFCYGLKHLDNKSNSMIILHNLSIRITSGRHFWFDLFWLQLWFFLHLQYKVTKVLLNQLNSNNRKWLNRSKNQLISKIVINPKFQNSAYLFTINHHTVDLSWSISSS